MIALEDALLADVRSTLDGWRIEYAGRPDLERAQLWLLALEREQIVAVAYREEAVAARVDRLHLDETLRATIRQTLVWIWKDEELHAEYLRGLLLQRRGLLSSLVVYGRQLQGALSGWVTATENHVDPESAPFRTGAAGLLVFAAGTTGRVPLVLQRELRFQTFRRYCELNVALEATAELAYRRLVELADNDDERITFAADPGRRVSPCCGLPCRRGRAHTRGSPRRGCLPAEFVADLGRITPFFLPAALRTAAAGGARPRTFGTGAPGTIRSGRSDCDKVAVLEECLDHAGLAALAAGARSVAIRVSFMLGYDPATART